MPIPVFREALPEDVPAICRVRMAVRQNRLSDPGRVPPQLVREYLSEHGRGWVCELAGRVVGFSIGDARDASVWALFVEPGEEGRGIGGRLHDLVVDWLWSLGADRITLSTEPGTRAEGFYRARGWTAEGRCDNGDLRLELRRPAGR